MTGILLIPNQNGTSVKTYGVKQKSVHIMKMLVFLYYFVSVASVYAELEYYPGFRRPSSIINWEKERDRDFAQDYAQDYVLDYALEHWDQIIREQQAQQRERQRQEIAEMKLLPPLPPLPPRLRPDFIVQPPREFIESEQDDFAVAPPDPRFYESIPVTYKPNIDSYSPDILQTRPKELTPSRPPVVQPRSEEQTTRAQNLAHRLHIQQTAARLLQAYPGAGGIAGQEAVFVKPVLQDDSAGVYVIAVVAGISAAATVGLIAFGIGWYNLQKNVKNASDVEYPAYGVTGPNKDVSPTGDRRLAQSAQMYHYQHQKQQIIAMERTAAAADRHGSLSEADSDEENEEGDYTVYECPGLAPTGEMEVKNPLFQDDTTPAAPGAQKSEEQPDQK